MGNGSTPDNLTSAIEPLATPIKTADDIRVVSMTLDAIAGALVRSQRIAKQLGSQKVSELAASSPELPNLLLAIGGKHFADAAAKAEALMMICRSSLVEFGSVDEVVSEANLARVQLHDALVSALDSIDA